MPATKEIFKKYPNRYFLETGTYFGHGTQSALEAGFRSVITIELSPQLAANARARFSGNNNVQVIEGDVCDVLWPAIAAIRDPITFWLDGHYSSGVTACGNIPDPIIQELDIIATHPIKTHTILIDDMRNYVSNTPITRDEIQQRLMRINPAYLISYEDGFVPSDILVARPNRQ